MATAARDNTRAQPAQRAHIRSYLGCPGHFQSIKSGDGAEIRGMRAQPAQRARLRTYPAVQATREGVYCIGGESETRTHDRVTDYGLALRCITTLPSLRSADGNRTRVSSFAGMRLATRLLRRTPPKNRTPLTRVGISSAPRAWDSSYGWERRRSRPTVTHP